MRRALSLWLLLTAIVSTTSAQITGADTVCQGQVTPYYTTVDASTHLWSVGSNSFTIINDTTISVEWNYVTTDQITVYYIDSQGDTTGSDMLSVVVGPQPTPVINPEVLLSCDSDLGFIVDDNADIIRDKLCIGANFAFRACDSSLANYFTSPTPGSTYEWTVYGGQIVGSATSPSVTIQWDTAVGSNAYLTLTETNLYGCVTTVNACVEIVSKPVAEFQADDVCSGAAVNFNNLSTGTGALFGTPYEWDFGDGNISFETNPSHVYASAGTYTVTLYVRNECNCTDSVQYTVTVDPAPAPQIECPSVVCAGDTAYYCTTAEGCSVYSWAVEGGQIILDEDSCITVVWGDGQAGPGIISLYVESCTDTTYCTDTTDIEIPIVPNAADIEGDTLICLFESYNYTLPFDQLPGTYFTWDVDHPGGSIQGASQGYGITDIDVYWTSTTFPRTPYDAKITVNWYNEFLGCGGTAEQIVHVRFPFYIRNDQSQVCVGDTTVHNAIMSYNSSLTVDANWDVGTNGTILYGNGTNQIAVEWNTPGTHQVVAYPVDPMSVCIDSAISNVIVNPIPDSVDNVTGPLAICPGGTYNYTAGTPQSGTEFCWYPVNGEVQGGDECATSVNITWDPTGPYEIIVYRKGTQYPYCSSEPFIVSVDTLSAVTAEITGEDTLCLNDTAVYTTVSGIGIDNYNWIVDPAYGTIIDGYATSAITVVWNGTAGNTTVQLTLDQCGAPYNASLDVYINNTAAPLITADTLCRGEMATLTAPAGYDNYLWTLPDGTPVSTGTNNTLSVSDSGTYLLDVSSASCPATAQYYLPLAPTPNAHISTPDPTVFCQTPIDVNLHALVGAGYSYLWSNGATTNPINVTDPGVYYVTVTNEWGCDSISNLIPVDSACDSCEQISPLTVTASVATPVCNPVNFTSSVTGDTPGIDVYYTWFFGDGTIQNVGTSTSATHIYDEPGYYYVQVFAIQDGDTCGVWDNLSIQVPIAAHFGVQSGVCEGDTMCFENLSNHITGVSPTYTWDFGDTQTAIGTGSGVCHEYTAPGSYTVTLTMTGGGCTTTFDTVITISPAPVANFNFDTVACVSTLIQFTDLSTPSANLASWAWDFGDGNGSSAQHTSHSYPVDGDYEVSLEVTDFNGCTATISDTITISQPLGADDTIAVSGPTVFCAGGSVVLTAPAGNNYQWSNGATSQSITVYNTDVYSVSYTSVDGCMYMTDGVAVTAIDLGATFTSSSTNQACEGSRVSLNVEPRTSGSNVYTYDWSHNGVPFSFPYLGLTGHPNPYYQYYLNDNTAIPDQSGLYTVVVTDTETGCTDTAYHLLQVDTLPEVPNITITGDSDNVACIGDTLTFTTDATGFFFWSTGATTQSITVLANPGINAYQVTVIDPVTGCSSETNPWFTGGVWVDPIGDMGLFMEGCYTKCGPDTLTFPTSGDYDFYWLYNGDSIGAPNSDLIVDESGEYQIVFISTSLNICRDTSGVMELTLINCCHLQGDFVADSVCIGEEICFFPLDTTESKHWWSFGDGTYSLEDTVCHTYTAADTFTVSHVAWDQECSSDTIEHEVIIWDHPMGSIQLLGCNPFCSGDSVYLTVNGMYTSVEWVMLDSLGMWNTIGYGDTISVDEGGTYNAVLFNGECVDSCLSITITEQPLPDINLNDTIICAGDSITLDAGAGYQHYQWSTGDTTQTIVVGAGEYWVEVGELNPFACCMCTNRDSVIVEENDLDVVLEDTVICAGDSVELIPTVTGGISPYTYQWTTGETTPTITVTNAGSYWVTVTDSLGCTASDSAEVTFDYPPSAAFDYQDTICVNDSVCFGADESGDWFVYNDQGYLIYDVAGLDTFCYSFPDTGDYQVTHTVTNTCGSDTVTHDIHVVAPVEACIKIIGQNPFCEGDSILLTIDDPFNQVTTVYWVDETGDTIFVGDTMVVYEAGTFTAFIQDQYGCTNSCMCVILDQVPAADVQLPDTVALCENSTATITATGGPFSQYVWYHDGAFFAFGDSVITATEPGQYIVTVENENGCEGSDTVEVLLTDFEVEIVASDDKICLGDTIVLSTICDPSYTYQWFDEFGNPIAGATTCSVTVAPSQVPFSDYTVVVTDTETGCIDRDRIRIKVKQVPCFEIDIFFTPNPARDQVTVHHYDVEDAKKMVMKVADVYGNIVEVYQLNANGENTTIDVSHLSQGTYFGTIIADEVMIQTKQMVILP